MPKRRIPKSSRLAIAIAAVLLGAALALPVWRIELIAPQYPEGLGMQIRFNTVQGVKEHDLANINELNHYIGMKVIDPSAMPELRYMPWIVGALAVTGLAVAASGRRRLAYAWAGAFGVACAAGLYDFWRWTYTYGHELDAEHAIIKVPGMAYQPPLIGTKQILNFTAASWPASGGVLIVAASVLVLAGLWIAVSRRPVDAGRIAA
ncbi:MAG TPA: hypothetical protein VF041_02150 [Gemmatimonadaceae bacterium]